MHEATLAREERVNGSDFAPLLREARDEGLLRRRTGWYALTGALDVAALAVLAAAVVYAGHTWWVLFLALPMTLFTVRCSFMGHDAGHQQIAGRRANRRVGLLYGNLLVGMSRGWWTDKHNRHHANPNHTEKDPDVSVGALVWTQQQAAERHGFTRWLTRHQARLFFPMLLLEGFALKVTSVRELRNRPSGERVIEGALLAAHIVGYVSLLVFAMGPGKAAVFALLHHALLGLHLGGVFAPNHKGMEMPDNDVRWGHLRRQVVTSRNVRGGPITDWMMGGLNYQIEHHLFPSMPRPALRRVRPLVRRHCAAAGLPYTETSLLASYGEALRHMHEVGAPLRAERAAARRAGAAGGREG